MLARDSTVIKRSVWKGFQNMLENGQYFRRTHAQKRITHFTDAAVVPGNSLRRFERVVLSTAAMYMRSSRPNTCSALGPVSAAPCKILDNACSRLVVMALGLVAGGGSGGIKKCCD